MSYAKKVRIIPGFVWVAIFVAWASLFSQANAKKAGTKVIPMQTVVDDLVKAQDASDASAKSDALNVALTDLEAALKLHTAHPQKESAMASLESAIDDLKNHDSAKADKDIVLALSEAREALAIRESDSKQTADNAPSSSSSERAALTVKLTEDQTRAVVLVKGDNAEGTGFLIKTADGPVVVTNIHVIANNPNINITTNTGVPVTILSYKGAADRDLVMISIKKGDFKYLDMATDITGTVQPGDEVITPGNSEGGEVMLNTDGKVLGIGPERVEFDNPIYHGNSGGPVIHVKSGKVIGVVSEAIKVLNSDELDKTSFASRNSAISGKMRYFGFRLDTVAKWEPYDWNNFQLQATFLDKFNLRSRCLDSYLNPPTTKKATSHKTASHKKSGPQKDGGDNQDDTQDAYLYLTDKQIMEANDTYVKKATNADNTERIQALRELVDNLKIIADSNMGVVQNMSNFYSFYQLRAKDEIAYRKALRTELDSCGDNVDRLIRLAR